MIGFGQEYHEVSLQRRGKGKIEIIMATEMAGINSAVDSWIHEEGKHKGSQVPQTPTVNKEQSSSEQEHGLNSLGKPWHE